MMAHTRKQQGQYRKIIKDDNPLASIFSVPSDSIPSSIPSSSSIPSVPSSLSSSTSSSSVPSSPPVIPMPDNQFKEIMSKVCADM